METNEIMNNEEIMETTEDIVTADFGKAGKAIAVAAGVIVVGGLVYKFIVKPLVAKAKAKKEEQAKAEVIDCENFDECEIEEEVE